MLTSFHPDTSPLQDLPTCITWQPGQGHVFGVGSEAGQVVVKDTRAAVCSTVSYTPHRRAVKRLQFSPVRYVDKLGHGRQTRSL